MASAKTQKNAKKKSKAHHSSKPQQSAAQPSAQPSAAEAAASQRQVVFYLHTHWDREWYRSFESYRYRLYRSLKNILTYLNSNPEAVFLLDGQTVVLEDYLAVCPEDLPQLLGLIASGRLQIGPWYVLPDEFLVSGESLVRNLQLGISQAQSWGQSAFLGYLPDMFGHLAQMPLILAQCQLEPALVWRGINPRSAWFNWQSLQAPQSQRPTGVKTLHLTKGYYQDALHQQPPSWELMGSFLEAIDAATPAERPLVLPVGADHMGLPTELESKLQALQQQFPNYHFKGVSLLEEARSWQSQPCEAQEQGELRSPQGAYVLPGVWSTRVYLKQLNAQAQLRLEKRTEPLLAWQWLSGGATVPALLRQAWKYLLQNHPHDSICGCSIDEVHQDMLPRFRWVQEIATELEASVLQSWGGQQLTPALGPQLNLLNTGGTAFAGVIEAWLQFPLEDAPASFELLAAGQPLACEILGQQDTEVFVAEPEILPHWQPVRRFHCLLQANVPAFSCQSLQVLASDQTGSAPATAVPGLQEISNAYCKVRYQSHTGRLQVFSKEEQTWIQLLEGHFFSDEGDAGDEYNYSPPAKDLQLELRFDSVRVETGALYQKMWLDLHSFVPASLHQNRQQRSNAHVPLHIQTEITLYAGEQRLHFKTTVHNQAKDHRLRLLWLSPYNQLRCRASTAFGSLERQAFAPAPLDIPKGQERPVDEFPFTDWIHVQAPDNQGWCWYSTGLHEASLCQWAGRPALALTLLRSVGWLSRDDLRTRGGGAGPRMPTPEAQCLGPQSFEYSLHLQGNNLAASLASVNQLRHGLLAFQGQQPALTGLFELSAPALQVSACMPAQAQDGIILRLVNELPENQQVSLRPLFACQQVQEVNLLEQALQGLASAEQAAAGLQFEMAAFEIKTLKFCSQLADNIPEPTSEVKR